MRSIMINGSTRTTDADTVEALLHSLSLDPRAVVVELNREIVRKPALSATKIADGDIVEIVHFVGGG